MKEQSATPDLPMYSIGPALVLVFVVLFLSVQVIVPAVKLMSPRPARFGWHMWTVTPPRRHVVLLMRDGTTRPADLRPYLAQGRGELDLDDVLPPHLCRMIPDVAAVHYRSRRTATIQIHPCP